MIERITDPACAAPLLRSWKETMLWSYLSGRMGEAFADDAVRPRSVLIRVGDFSFLAGAPNAELAASLPLGRAAFTIAVPQTAAWAAAIECSCPKTKRITRYAFQKQDAFDRDRLRSFAASLPDGYSLHRMDERLYHLAAAEEWSCDLVSQYPCFADYAAHGAGFAVLYGGGLVCGASSYTDWPEGIEIEIDCCPAHRRKGLARACAAALVLDCLARGLYPSWDAANPVSAHLAEMLGYLPAGPYPAYEAVK